MSGYHNNSIFWVETRKIQPNPFQPRREFDQKALEDLADSIRQYGVLQPLVVTRKETVRPDNNGIDVHYELIAGERRLRASQIAGLQQVPVIIRKETDDKVKLELAIIENLQREDLNAIDRALAFEQLYKEFGLTHVEIGKRMGKSRVYVSNTLRLLSLPDEIKRGLIDGRITEGHTRPLLMLSDRPDEQTTLYKEIMIKKLSVRDAEKVARKIAQDKVRKKEFIVDPKIREFEQKLSENLGTRVHIEPKEKGGQITIDYFTIKDLESILSSMNKIDHNQDMMSQYIENNPDIQNQLESATGINVVAEESTHAPVSVPDTEVIAKDIPAKVTDITKEVSSNNVDVTYAPKENSEITTLNQSEGINNTEQKDTLHTTNKLTFEDKISNQTEEVPTQSDAAIEETISQSHKFEKKDFETPRATTPSIQDYNQPPSNTEMIAQHTSTNSHSVQHVQQNQPHQGAQHQQAYARPQQVVNNQTQYARPQSGYYTQPTATRYNQPPQSNNSQNFDYAYNQTPIMPKKKGFFGKLFS